MKKTRLSLGPYTKDVADQMAVIYQGRGYTTTVNEYREGRWWVECVPADE